MVDEILLISLGVQCIAFSCAGVSYLTARGVARPKGWLFPLWVLALTLCAAVAITGLGLTALVLRPF